MKRLRGFTIILLIFVGIGAVYGGIVLILDPSGDFLQMPISLLEPTPFKSFLVPGILLFSLNGIFCLIVAFMLIKRKKFSEILVIIQGIILSMWIIIQIILIEDFFPPLHVPYFLFGIILIFLGRYLKIKQQTS